MTDTGQTNAMAEVALALAMGFFSIMVLTMVSMGAGAPGKPSDDGVALDPGLRLVEAAGHAADDAGSAEAVRRDDLVLFHGGRFRDGALAPLDPASLRGRERIVLAVGPGLTLSDAMAAKAAIPASEVIVTTFGQDWLERLEETKR